MLSLWHLTQSIRLKLGSWGTTKQWTSHYKQEISSVHTRKHSVNSLYILRTEMVIRVRNSLALAEQGRGVAMVRCGGTHLVKWFRVYRAKWFNTVGSITSKKGKDNHSHTCLLRQLGSMAMLTIVLLGRTASLPLSMAGEYWEDKKLGTASLCSHCCCQRSAPQSRGICPHSYCHHLIKSELTFEEETQRISSSAFCLSQWRQPQMSYCRCSFVCILMYLLTNNKENETCWQGEEISK